MTPVSSLRTTPSNGTSADLVATANMETDSAMDRFRITTDHNVDGATTSLRVEHRTPYYYAIGNMAVVRDGQYWLYYEYKEDGEVVPADVDWRLDFDWKNTWELREIDVIFADAQTGARIQTSRPTVRGGRH